MSETAVEQGTTSVQTTEDYFGFQATERYTFPDGKQWIEFEVMNEGKKAQFQRATSRDLILERQTQNARMKTDAATDRHELIKSSVTDWNMYRQGVAIPFTPGALNDFLQLANPRIIEDIEKAIRKANPWLMAEMSSKDIRREIQNLEEMERVALEREQGEASSGGK